MTSPEVLFPRRLPQQASENSPVLNWAKNATLASAQAVITPENEAELQQVVANARGRVRVMGSRMSPGRMVALKAPGDLLIDLSRLRGVPLTGILWYQGESNASVAIGGEPDKPLDEAYMAETLRAIVQTLKGLNPKRPPLIMGLPRLNRPWAPYRALQRKVCAEEGAILIDTFAAGLGDPNNVHPADKRPFADLASRAAAAPAAE